MSGIRKPSQFIPWALRFGGDNFAKAVTTRLVRCSAVYNIDMLLDASLFGSKREVRNSKLVRIFSIPEQEYSAVND